MNSPGVEEDIGGEVVNLNKSGQFKRDKKNEWMPDLVVTVVYEVDVGKMQYICFELNCIKLVFIPIWVERSLLKR